MEELEESGSRLRLAGPASPRLLLLREWELFRISVSSLHHSQGILPTACSGPRGASSHPVGDRVPVSRLPLSPVDPKHESCPQPVLAP